MEIKQIIDKKFKTKWNNFVVLNSSPASFLQSWEWGEFKNQENKIIRFIIERDNKLIAVAQFFKVALPNGKFYLNCVKGPIIKFSIFNFQFPKKILDLIVNEIKKIAKQEKIIFFRIAPPYKMNNELGIMNYEFIKPKILVNLKEPENTLILDLKKSEEELLKAMHQKTRYNIHLAEKKEIIIKQEKNIDIFYNLIQETAERDKINIFNKNYYKKLFTINSDDFKIILFIASYKSQPLAAIIVVGFGDTATYFYGASSNEKRNLMPNYLIQWQAIKWAKENKYRYYDFWGIQGQETRNEKQETKEWFGITRFKRGFANNETGKEINFIGTFDYIFSKKWYNIFKIGKIIKNIL